MAKPAQGTISVLSQLCKTIPPFLVSKVAREHGCDKQARTFSPWSHVCAMLYSQLAHSLSLNDLCDDLRMQSGKLSAVRDATPPARNTLSNANMKRSSGMARDLFWRMLGHLQESHPGFGPDRRYGKYPHRFRRLINAIDSTTIQLVANCMDWAKHRRRKAAAKCHFNLNLDTFLPRACVVDSAKGHDSRKAAELCADIRRGEIAVFDMAYVDTAFLRELDFRGVFWVSRLKPNLEIKSAKKLKGTGGRILENELVRFSGVKTAGKYPKNIRKVAAIVEVDGTDTRMEFITNNMEWAPQSIVDLYRCRWGVEVFFKELKQTLQLADFLGNTANAVQWQVWTALLAYLLLRFLKFRSGWKHSFSRLFTLVRAMLWEKYDAVAVLARIACGTAPGPPKLKSLPRQAYLPGFEALLA